MSEQPIITVVGPGVMGEAIIAGLLRNGLTVPEKIRASVPSSNAARRWKSDMA